MLSAALVLAFIAQAPPPNVDAEVRLLASGRLRLSAAIAAEPQLVAAVKAKNASGESSEEVLRRDKEWRANPRHPLRAEVTGSSCAARLREMIKGEAFVVEAFLSDARGALVCASGETSDYWQGDEDKWKKTFAEGRDLLVEEAAWDASTATYAIQLSQLVKDHSQKVGVLTMTIRIPLTALGERR